MKIGDRSILSIGFYHCIWSVPMNTLFIYKVIWKKVMLQSCPYQKIFTTGIFLLDMFNFFKKKNQEIHKHSEKKWEIWSLASSVITNPNLFANGNIIMLSLLNILTEDSKSVSTCSLTWENKLCLPISRNWWQINSDWEWSETFQQWTTKNCGSGRFLTYHLSV